MRIRHSASYSKHLEQFLENTKVEDPENGCTTKGAIKYPTEMTHTIITQVTGETWKCNRALYFQKYILRFWNR